MNKIIELIEEKYDYDFGVINNGRYHKLDKPFEDNVVINIKLTKKEVNNLIGKFNENGIILSLEDDNDYWGMYTSNLDGVAILFSYVLKSHTQVPKLLLKRFADGDKLFILNTENNEIRSNSASTYNRKFGYYNMHFEKYLKNNYEDKMGELISNIESFVNKKQDKLIIEDILGMSENIFRMALFRSPRFVKGVNDQSIYSAIIDGGYDHEHIAYMMEDMNDKLLKNMKVFLMVNETKMGLVTLKPMASNLTTKGYDCMILPLDPKFALLVVPDEYYQLRVKEHGKDSYMKIDDENTLLLINSIIYDNAKHHGDDVIGRKKDLENILKNK